VGLGLVRRLLLALLLGVVLLGCVKRGSLKPLGGFAVAYAVVYWVHLRVSAALSYTRLQRFWGLLDSDRCDRCY